MEHHNNNNNSNNIVTHRDKFINFIINDTPRIWAFSILMASFVRMCKGENDYMENFILITFCIYFSSILLTALIISVVRKKSPKFENWYLSECNNININSYSQIPFFESYETGTNEPNLMSP